MHFSENTSLSPITAGFPKPDQGWQQALARAISDPRELLALLQLKPEDLPFSLEAGKSFSMRVPREFAARMRKGDPDDPLLLQVLPLENELEITGGYSLDPVGDRQSEAIPGLLHKYHGRALLLLTGACGIHCRYCFRRHFPYAEANPAANRWRQALEYLAAHPEIEEVILSGGDPLSLRDDRLAELVSQLEQIPHLVRLRIHTRLAIVLPSRIGDELLDWIRNTRLQVVLVTHCNHPNEISHDLVQHLSRLSQAGVVLLNQSVLLRGINDRVETLAELSGSLFSAGILPYYLHMLDRVAGAAHFEVPRQKALALVQELNKRLPGYLVPRLVQELAGEPAKSPVF